MSEKDLLNLIAFGVFLVLWQLVKDKPEDRKSLMWAAVFGWMTYAFGWMVAFGGMIGCIIIHAVYESWKESREWKKIRASWDEEDKKDTP